MAQCRTKRSENSSFENFKNNIMLEHSDRSELSIKRLLGHCKRLKVVDEKLLHLGLMIRLGALWIFIYIKLHYITWNTIIDCTYRVSDLSTFQQLQTWTETSEAGTEIDSDVAVVVSCEICHFEDGQYNCPREKKRLVWNAVPTLFIIPNPPPKVTVFFNRY